MSKNVSVMGREQYVPSKYILSLYLEGSLKPCRGLPELVALLEQWGNKVMVDFGEGDPLEIVHPDNVVMSVHEVDEARLHVDDGNGIWASLFVIAGNDEDWLCDYSCSDMLEDALNATVHERNET